MVLKRCSLGPFGLRMVPRNHENLVARIDKFSFVAKFSLIIQTVTLVTTLFEGKQCNDLLMEISACHN